MGRSPLDALFGRVDGDIFGAVGDSLIPVFERYIAQARAEMALRELTSGALLSDTDCGHEGKSGSIMGTREGSQGVEPKDRVICGPSDRYPESIAKIISRMSEASKRSINALDASVLLVDRKSNELVTYRELTNSGSSPLSHGSRSNEIRFDLDSGECVTERSIDEQDIRQGMKASERRRRKGPSDKYRGFALRVYHSREPVLLFGNEERDVVGRDRDDEEVLLSYSPFRSLMVFPVFGIDGEVSIPSFEFLTSPHILPSLPLSCFCFLFLFLSSSFLSLTLSLFSLPIPKISFFPSSSLSYSSLSGSLFLTSLSLSLFSLFSLFLSPFRSPFEGNISGKSLRQVQ